MAESTAGTQLPRSPLPRHVAIIMDGNGRWAESRGLPRLDGHREGANSVRDVVRAARKIGLEALTLYAFSSQNWARPGSEVAGLMDLLRDYLVGERTEIMENGIQLRAIGDIDRLPTSVREPLDALVADSAGNSDMVLISPSAMAGESRLPRPHRDLPTAWLQANSIRATSPWIALVPRCQQPTFPDSTC